MRFRDRLLENDDKKSAMKVLKESLLNYAENEKVLSKYVELWDGISDERIALAVLRRLASLCPKEAYYKALLGNAYLANDLFGLALEAYEQADALAEGKEGWILGNIGNVYNRKNFYPKAIEYLKRGLTLEPDSGYLHKRLSEALESTEVECKKADKIIKRANEEMEDLIRKEEKEKKTLQEGGSKEV
ncbi:MAG TPA: hypothetical protein VF131_21500 [Blastocatellia bacterium]|nr:hypothetical protein [Blastocatellia bacterium]